MHKSDFEKIKSKNSKMVAKGANLRMWAIIDAGEWWIYNGGLGDAIIEKRKYDKDVR